MRHEGIETSSKASKLASSAVFGRESSPGLEMTILKAPVSVSLAGPLS